MQTKGPLVAQLICPPVFLVGVLESRHQSESQAIKSEKYLANLLWMLRRVELCAKLITANAGDWLKRRSLGIQIWCLRLS